ncbi:MAG: glycosyl transferase family 1, partial [Spirochaetes bacterium]|nr:glycosyl transferase family 1 [Spirochaetota bacterium]
MKKILAVGQTPPPYGGQAIMIKTMLEGEYKDVELIHIKMNFSSEMDEIGKLKIFKVFKLIGLISKIIFFRFYYNTHILYYP